MSVYSGLGSGPVRMGLGRKLWEVNWGLVLLLFVVAGISFAMLYSVAGGNVEPWAKRQALLFAGGVVVMLVIAVIDIRLWLKLAYLGYFAALVLLILVEPFGEILGGAKRWLRFGGLQLQPSELMKIALVLALARYYHGLSQEQIKRAVYLAPPLVMFAVPAALMLRQPDLGTTLLQALMVGAIFFMAGVRLRMFAIAAAGALTAIPVAWQFLHDYQKQRVLTLFNPEADALGTGYHILQSKIALGSGGIFGKGFLQGTQSRLSFLPEKQTDFIFTALAEEFGMVGGLGLLGLYTVLVVYGFVIALRCKSQFGRLVAIGIATMFFLYAFVNIGMVMGLLPVVGVPLPLISYGGTAMMTLMIGFGLVMSAHIHRDVTIPRRPGSGLE